jgi:hypothetical protein
MSSESHPLDLLSFASRTLFVVIGENTLTVRNSFAMTSFSSVCSTGSTVMIQLATLAYLFFNGFPVGAFSARNFKKINHIIV